MSAHAPDLGEMGSSRSPSVNSRGHDDKDEESERRSKLEVEDEQGGDDVKEDRQHVEQNELQVKMRGGLGSDMLRVSRFARPAGDAPGTSY